MFLYGVKATHFVSRTWIGSDTVMNIQELCITSGIHVSCRIKGSNIPEGNDDADSCDFNVISMVLGKIC